MVEASLTRRGPKLPDPKFKLSRNLNKWSLGKWPAPYRVALPVYSAVRRGG